MINSGASGGTVCALIYVFGQSQGECCGCPITPDGLLTLSVNTNLTFNSLTPGPLTTGVIDIVGSTAKNCDPAKGISPSASLAAWGTLFKMAAL